MGRGTIVTAPDGAKWRVRRQWLEQPLPDLARSFKTHRSKKTERGILNGLTFADFGESGAAIALAIGIVVVVFVVLPLLGVALELIAVVFVLLAGLFGRLLLGRPWIVEAVNLDAPEERVAFAARGWRQSSEALRELRAAIAAAGPPDRIAAGEALATR
ncbi:MAG: hypothetical protein ACTHO8_12825 [Solirubrobacterales bacterium]